MIELLKTSIAGANFIPTSMLVLILLYWLAVIIGALDVHLFHIHIDTDIDTHIDTHIDTDLDTHVDTHDGGLFYTILAFLKVKDIPFMVIVSIIVVVFWSGAMFLHLLPIRTGGLLNAVLLIPVFIFSVISCRYIAIPLKGLFGNNDNLSDREVIIGKVCIVLCNVFDERLGQAEVASDNKSYVINIKSADGAKINKGEKAFVIKKDNEKNFYLVKKFEGVD
ncbi:OB-fold-containig protein [Pseudobacteroides cellulosolvens]|uniref:Uncharacterized protein n=1 Tax=Pseudobacteroides cellulosolvens ATCC 35603 = DSM 2933 TaxID=398512 RepID=A0A0L6JHG0_9FIRM|nr:OB-fold-containig protein [Pseudobacteroides cellulosolvens]KNY25159.1 hypothetical protein Bccel_0416 [Pseudobacteroides cellulosolvens ATCC 35603 = DSM 2933]